MTIESELLNIKGDADLLVAEDIVDWAREHPTSELHKQFEWDNRKAADEYRLWQARRVVAIYLRFEDSDERSFISLRIDRTKSGGGFRSLDDVKQAPDLMELALRDALDDLRRVEHRYKFLRELSEIWKEAEKVRAKPRRKARQAERGAAQQRRAEL